MLGEDQQLSEMHLSDEELLLAADGELVTGRTAQVQAHLAACWDCRARMAEIESTIAEFVRAHRRTLDPQLPPIEGPRAQLRAELAQLSSQRETGSWRGWFQLPAARAAAVVLLICGLAVGAGWFFGPPHKLRESFYEAWHDGWSGASSGNLASEQGAIPNRSLTPGATRSVSIGEVCSMAHEEVVGEVSTSLRQEVFREYGIRNPRADDYEIDYLIAPGLGGTEDIRNLWPEPYQSRTWNAHVKDALEERLHEMVCAGNLDLSAAQRDIAVDWIAAYKKYFHTAEPLSVQSDLMQPDLMRRAQR
jgi:predicted anti-sigma-YlaC factor YlaD